MEIGLVDVDSHNFPSLPLMKISAWHKARGDNVEFALNIKHYDRVYVSKVFGDEYSQLDPTIINADEVIYGGTGFAIDIKDGKEVYDPQKDKMLPYEIEHIYPDYELYPQYTKDTAYGFLTRGCCNNCEFCIVSQKEGLCSTKVADLSEWWNGQKNIVLMDANILACKDRMELLTQLADSGAKVDFTQGLDARFITPEVAEALNRVKAKMWHFAFDRMENELRIVDGLRCFADKIKLADRSAVYVLTGYDTTVKEDLYRIGVVAALGFLPDVRIYRKNALPKRHILRDLQRWCNNRAIYKSQPDFWQYAPRADGLTMAQQYPREFEEVTG